MAGAGQGGSFLPEWARLGDIGRVTFQEGVLFTESCAEYGRGSEVVVGGWGDGRLGCWVVLWLVICSGVGEVDTGGGCCCCCRCWIPRQERSCELAVVNVTTVCQAEDDIVRGCQQHAG